MSAAVVRRVLVGAAVVAALGAAVLVRYWGPRTPEPSPDTAAQAVTARELDAAAGERVFIGHMSIGWNLLDGMARVYAAKGVAEPERQIALCRETMMKNYSVHALELMVKQQRAEAAAPDAAPRREPVEKTAHVKGIEDDLRHRLAVKVEIKVKARDRGQIVIGFETNDDFERILEALKK